MTWNLAFVLNEVLKISAEVFQGIKSLDLYLVEPMVFTKK